MKRLYLIWSFLQIVLLLHSSSPVFGQIHNPKGDNDTIIIPQFGDFYMGLTYQEVREKLKKHKVTLEDFNSSFFRINIPIYDLLTNVASQDFVDVKKERIYYDDETFFDLQNILLSNKIYKFYYLDPYYLLSINDVKVVSVDYPSRVNPRLDSLKFKFFQNRLYAVEYKASDLKAYEIQRIRDNYMNRYGAMLLEKENFFKTKEGIFFVKYNRLEAPNGVTIILMGYRQFTKMKDYMDSVIKKLVFDLGVDLNKRLYNAGSGKNLVLSDRKNVLYKKLVAKYGAIDQF